MKSRFSSHNGAGVPFHGAGGGRAPVGPRQPGSPSLGLHRWGLAGGHVSGLRCSERQVPHLWAIPTTRNKVGGWVCRRPSSRCQGVHVCETRSVNPRPLPFHTPSPIRSTPGRARAPRLKRLPKDQLSHGRPWELSSGNQSLVLNSHARNKEGCDRNRRAPDWGAAS